MMHKRLRYKLSTIEQPEKWLVVEFIRPIDQEDNLYIIREMHGWTLDEFRETDNTVTKELIEVELDKKPYVPEPPPTLED
jgi:hypothetical protein